VTITPPSSPGIDDASVLKAYGERETTRLEHVRELRRARSRRVAISASWASSWASVASRTWSYSHSGGGSLTAGGGSSSASSRSRRASPAGPRRRRAVAPRRQLLLDPFHVAGFQLLQRPVALVLQHRAAVSQEAGWEIDPEELVQVSPYLTEHILRFGEYRTHELGIQPEAYGPKLDMDVTQLRVEDVTGEGFGQAA